MPRHLRVARYRFRNRTSHARVSGFATDLTPSVRRPIVPPHLAMQCSCMRRLVFVVICASSLLAVVLRADNWPQWRGPDGDGTSRETDLPIDLEQDVGHPLAMPVCPSGATARRPSGTNSIFLTTQVDNDKLLLLKIDKKTRPDRMDPRRSARKPARIRRLQGKSDEQRRHQWFDESHNFASPSPVTDGQRVVVHFGNGDLAAYDFDGKQLWHRNLQKDYGDYTIWWGHANSPVLYDDLVISICMQDSCADLPGKPSPSYVVAHDMRTGQRALEDDAHDGGHARKLRLLHHADPLEERRPAGNGRAGRADARRLRPGHRQASVVAARPDRQSHDHRPGGRRTA